MLGRVAHRRTAEADWQEPRGVLRSRLLATLLARVGEPVPHDELVEVLWGGQPDDRVTAKLHLQVHRLRQELGAGDLVVATEYGYRLAVGPDAVDAGRFEAAARRALATAESDPERSVLARAALAEWPDPVAGVAYDGTDVPCCADEAERLALLRLDVAEAHLAAEVGAGHHLEVVHQLQQLASAHPLRESLQALLMDALHQGGRQTEALEVYRATRALLVNELGLEPSPQLRAAQEVILSGATTPVPAPAQLPPAVPLLGRADDVAAVDAATTGAVGPCVITGPPGVGKTALAVAWAAERAARFPDGQLFADLRGFSTDPPRDPGGVLDGFVRALGGDPRHLRGLSERTATYRSLLAGRRMLVVLDNARDTEQVRPLLPGVPECQVIVTSRDRLTGLSVRDHARRVVLGPLTEEESLAVLAGDRADDDRWRAVARRCGHLPLLLRIAAERLRDDPAAMPHLASVASSVPSLDLLETGDPQSSARTVLSWSYLALSPDAAAAFRALGVNPAPTIDRGGLAVLAGLSTEAVRPAVDELLRAFLVEDHGGWLAQHDVLAGYARECAQAESEGSSGRTGAADRAVADLVRYYSSMVSRARTWTDLGEPVEEFGTVDHAHEWLTACLEPVAAVMVAAPGISDEDLPVLAKKLVIVASRRGRIHLADRMGAAARAAALRSGDTVGLATAEWVTGSLLGRTGDPAALDHFEQAARLIATTDDRDTEMIISNNHAVELYALGRLPAALERFIHAKQMFVQVKRQHHRELVVDSNIGEVLRVLGRIDEAEQLLEQTVRAAEARGLPELASKPLVNLAAIHLERGELAAAERVLDRYHVVTVAGIDREYECEVLLLRGRIALTVGDLAAAGEACAQAALLAEQVGVLRLRVDSAVGLASVRAVDDPEAALLDLDTAMAMARRHSAGIAELGARRLQHDLLLRTGRERAAELVAARISVLEQECGLVRPES